MSGKVYLVGAGPGDEGLITAYAKSLLKDADIVFYDRLANDQLLKWTSPEAELVYVGKKAGDHSYSQQEINKLLIEKAKEGKLVLRLKGGDSFIFGRGGEETLALKEAEVEFEVVPGITSAAAVPAYAGIPLTHRDFSSSAAFVSGHLAPGSEKDVNWEQLAQGVETLVILMGVGNLDKIVDKLLAAGRSPQTPIALIRWGSWPKQETIKGKLENIVSKVREAQFKPPAVTVVGEVVKLREKLNWFETKPLFGRQIAVTRPPHQAESFCRLLRRKGANPLTTPAIEIEPPESFGPLDDKLAHLGDYDWVIFTSQNGVDYTLERLFALGDDVRAFGSVKIAAIGSKTGARLEEYGLRADYVPKEYVSEALLEGFSKQDLTGQKFFLPRADIARPKLETGLENLGAEVDNITAYQTVRGSEVEDLLPRLKEGTVEVVTFTSSSTVQNLLSALGEDYQDLLAEVKLACIGPITAQTAEKAGLEVDITAEEYTIEGLVRAIEEYFS